MIMVNELERWHWQGPALIGAYTDLWDLMAEKSGATWGPVMPCIKLKVRLGGGSILFSWTASILRYAKSEMWTISEASCTGRPIKFSLLITWAPSDTKPVDSLLTHTSSSSKLANCYAISELQRRGCGGPRTHSPLLQATKIYIHSRLVSAILH